MRVHVVVKSPETGVIASLSWMFCEIIYNDIVNGPICIRFYSFINNIVYYVHGHLIKIVNKVYSFSRKIGEIKWWELSKICL